jgi:large subunit ribosomal protein L25
MATASLNATPRLETGKGVARSLRRDGQVPGVIYGHKRDAQPLAVNARDLERLLEKVTVSTVIELNLGGITTRTLIREIQRHPYKKQFIHIDFQELVAGEKVTVQVPLVFHGTPEGVKAGGGLLDVILHEVTVRADAASIPDHIDVDIANVVIGHPLHLGEITLPAGVEVVGDEEQAVVIVSAPRAQEETPTVATEAVAEPELIRKPKADEE